MNMVDKFKKNTWYKIDLILNWKNNKVSIYVNGVGKSAATTGFFIDEKKKTAKTEKKVMLKANAISIYGLSPDGDSKFSGIRMCNDICDGENSSNLKDLGGVAIYAISALTSVSALAL